MDDKTLKEIEERYNAAKEQLTRKCRGEKIEVEPNTHGIPRFMCYAQSDIFELLHEAKQAEKLRDEVNRLQGDNQGLRDMIERLGENHAKEYGELWKKNERLQAELDAAVKQIYKRCGNCKHWRVNENVKCVAPGNTPCDISRREAWEWRGSMKGE